MEAASVPAESGGDPGEAPGGQSPAVDLSPVLDRVGEVGQSVQSLNERLAALEQPPDGGDEYGDGDPYGDPGGEPEFDPYQYGDPEQMTDEQAQQWLHQVVDQRAQQQAEQLIQKQVEPLMEQLDEINLERETGQFLQEFPEFADEERAEAFIGHANEIVDDLPLPDEVKSKLIGSASFLKIVAQAARHAEAGRTEQPVQDAQEHPLEPAGGANLGGGEPNIAQQIVKARGGNAFWGT